MLSRLRPSLPVLLAIIAFCASCSLCKNDIQQEVISPNKELRGVSFTRDCGATTALFTQVSILNSDEALSNNSGNILVLNDNSPVQLTWENDRHLIIRYPFSVATSLKEESFDGISISYTDAVARATSPLDPLPYLSGFPTEQLLDMEETITRNIREELLLKGTSGNWKLSTQNKGLGSITLEHEPSSSRMVFLLFTPVSPSDARAAVYQEFEQSRDLSFWKLDNGSWSEIAYRLPSLKKFVSSESYTNPQLNEVNLLPYLNFEFRRDTVMMTLDGTLFQSALIHALNRSEDDIGTTLSVLDSRNYIRYKNAFVHTPENDFATLQIPDPFYRPEAEIHATTVAAHEGDGPEPLDWACPQEVTVKVSSELKPQAGSDYKKDNLLDHSFSTAWVEGAEGSGLGQSIEFKVTGNALIGESYLFVNGYAKNTTAWKNNNRVRKLRCFINNVAVANIYFQDTNQLQSFTVSPWWLNRNPTKKGDLIRFEIVEVFKGDRYDDTAISLFVPDGNCG